VCGNKFVQSVYFNVRSPEIIKMLYKIGIIFNKATTDGSGYRHNIYTLVHYKALVNHNNYFCNNYFEVPVVLLDHMRVAKDLLCKNDDDDAYNYVKIN